MNWDEPLRGDYVNSIGEGRCILTTDISGLCYQEKRHCLSGSRKDPTIKKSSLGNSFSEQGMHPVMAGLSLNRCICDRMLGAVEYYSKTKAMEK